MVGETGRRSGRKVRWANSGTSAHSAGAVGVRWKVKSVGGSRRRAEATTTKVAMEVERE